MKNKIKWFLPILVILILAPFTPKLDLFFARAVYKEGFFFNPLPFRLLYEYGEFLGFFAGGCSLLFFLLSFKTKKIEEYRAPALAFLLTIIIGAGLITNICLKGYWGRPRPKQITEFGGQFTYRPYYKPVFAPTEKQKSFPSGHVAMGFSYLSFLFSFRRMGKKGLYYLSLLITILLGGGLMVARVTQGGHFFSDVTFSFMLMWVVAHLSDKWVFGYVE